MTPLARTALVAIPLAVAAAAPAQELNLAATTTARPGIVEARTGLDHALLAEVGYRRVLAWGDQQIFVGGDVGIPWARPDLEDHRLRLSVGVPRGWEHWKFAGWISPTLRGTENAAADLAALGVDLRLVGGYYARRWFVAGEVGVDWVAATHVTFSDAYRAHGYEGARDGWYRTPGGTTYTGLHAGVSFTTFDLIVRAGVPRTTALEAQTLPVYVTVGVNVSLLR
jgi:hypothetical protein